MRARMKLIIENWEKFLESEVGRATDLQGDAGAKEVSTEEPTDDDRAAIANDQIRGDLSGGLFRQCRRAHRLDFTRGILGMDFHTDVVVSPDEWPDNQARAGFQELDGLRGHRLGDGSGQVARTLTD